MNTKQGVLSQEERLDFCLTGFTQRLSVMLNET
jgi:hypothetical protein